MSHSPHHRLTTDEVIKDAVQLGVAAYAADNVLTGKDPRRHGIVGQAAHVAGQYTILHFAIPLFPKFVVLPYLAVTAAVMAIPAALYQLLVPLTSGGDGVRAHITAGFWVLVALGIIGWAAQLGWTVLKLRRPKHDPRSNGVWVPSYLILTGVIFNLPTLIWAIAIRHSLDANANIRTLSPAFWIVATGLLAIWLRWLTRKHLFKQRRSQPSGGSPGQPSLNPSSPGTTTVTIAPGSVSTGEPPRQALPSGARH